MSSIVAAKYKLFPDAAMFLVWILNKNYLDEILKEHNTDTYLYILRGTAVPNTSEFLEGCYVGTFECVELVSIDTFSPAEFHKYRSV